MRYGPLGSASTRLLGLRTPPPPHRSPPRPYVGEEAAARQGRRPGVGPAGALPQPQPFGPAVPQSKVRGTQFSSTPGSCDRRPFGHRVRWRTHDSNGRGVLTLDSANSLGLVTQVKRCSTRLLPIRGNVGCRRSAGASVDVARFWWSQPKFYTDSIFLPVSGLLRSDPWSRRRIRGIDILGQLMRGHPPASGSIRRLFACSVLSGDWRHHDGAR